MPHGRCHDEWTQIRAITSLIHSDDEAHVARQALGATFAPDELGPVLFKGKSEPTLVWALGPGLGA